MYYPLTVRDFLDRAAHVYPDRVAVVDEPEQPGPSLGELTYRELAALARAQAAKLDQLDVPVGGRVAVISQNSARLLTSFFGVSGWGRVLVPVNFRLTQSEIDYIVRHSGASVVYADASCADVLDTLDVKHKFVLGDDEDLFLRDTEPREWATPDERDGQRQLHLRNDRPPQGSSAHPPQSVAERGRVRAAHHDQRP